MPQAKETKKCSTRILLNSPIRYFEYSKARTKNRKKETKEIKEWGSLFQMRHDISHMHTHCPLTVNGRFQAWIRKFSRTQFIKKSKFFGAHFFSCFNSIRLKKCYFFLVRVCWYKDLLAVGINHVLHGSYILLRAVTWACWLLKVRSAR